MTLQVFQCGLSWRIVLTKAKDITAAFYNFDVAKVAAMTPADVEAPMQNGNTRILCVLAFCDPAYRLGLPNVSCFCFQTRSFATRPS